MAVVRPEIKDRLKADGRWSAFTKVRMAKVAEGMKPADALDMAIAAVCPDLAGLASSRKRGPKPNGGLRARAAGRSADSDRADAVERIVAAKEKLAAMDAEQDAAKKAGREGALVGVGVFDGKAASAAEEVLWVAKNLNMKVEAADAPGPLAWNMLCLCRESAEFRVKFMLNIASDVVKRRTEEDEGRDGKFDGVEEFDLLGEFAKKVAEVGG